MIYDTKTIDKDLSARIKERGRTPYSYNLYDPGGVGHNFVGEMINPWSAVKTYLTSNRDQIAKKKQALKSALSKYIR